MFIGFLENSSSSTRQKEQNLGQIHLNEGCFFDVPGRKLGSMVRINGLFHLLINGGILGLQPIYKRFTNFLGHPSELFNKKMKKTNLSVCIFTDHWSD